jgi:hypothetical protein
MLNGLTRKSIFATLILSSAALAPLVRAADGDPVDPKIATNISITGCLHAGEHFAQFVLVGVTELAPDGSVIPVPYAIYMLNSTKDMKQLVGQLVDVKGVVVSRDKRQGIIKINVSADAQATTDVTVETGEKKDTTTKPFAGWASAESVVEINRPVYRIGVESITAEKLRQSGPACK